MSVRELRALIADVWHGNMLALSVAIFGSILLSGCGGSGGNSQPAPNNPPATESLPLGPSRKGLWLSYFGSDNEQVAETADHVSMLFAAFGDDQALANRIALAAMPTILDVSDCLFTPTLPRKIHPEANARIRSRLAECALITVNGVGAHRNVRALYIIDEPERESDVSADDVIQACALARAAASEFGITPALHICYGDSDDYRGSEFIDWIGVNGAYRDSAQGYRERISRVPLKAGQKIVLYPGCAEPYLQDPRPFYDLAQSNLDIIGICAFLWVDYSDPNGQQKKGLRNLPLLLEQYRDVGLEIRKANGT